jgi:hypothetical protein
MASEADVSLVVEKIRAATAQGDQVMGTVFGKPVAEWKDVFNEAAQQLSMPVIHIDPLKSGDLRDVSKHLTDIQKAFRRSATAPAIVLVDSSGNDKITDERINWQIANFIEGLTKQFGKAVYVQVVTDGISQSPVNMYCMNPKIPHDRSKPIYPV